MKKLLLILLVLVFGAVMGCNGVVPDTTPPVITLLGENPLNLNVNDQYVEPGAVALDDKDGDITHKIVIGGDVVDTSTPGIYIVTYFVKDRAGNVAETIRTVNVLYPFTGLWLNIDENTKSITKVLIEKKGNNFAIEMWGKCYPDDCYWGEKLVEIRETSSGSFELVWEFGFSTKTQQVTLIDTALKVVSTTVLSSGFTYSTIDIFQK
jgi:hypothetical protein